VASSIGSKSSSRAGGGARLTPSSALCLLAYIYLAVVVAVQRQHDAVPSQAPTPG